MTESNCTFSRKVIRRPGQGRQTKRKDDSEDSSSEDETKIVRKEKKLAPNPLVQKTQKRDRPKFNEDDDEGSSTSRKDFAYSAVKSSERMGPTDMGATATLEIETPHDRDAQAIFEKAQLVNKELKEKGDDGVYRGLNNYTQFLPKKDTSQGNASSGMVRKGPIRAPTNVRASVRWDYAPDICKDYKETGFCGFGDSCIFLHDRSDYKHGWQLERDVEKKTYGKNDAEAKKYEIPSDDEDSLPFKCLICRDSFKNPVVTKCKHYFCESCALANYKKSTRCLACNQQTMGVFNPAKELMARIKKKAEENKANGVEEIEGTGEPGDGEEDGGHAHNHDLGNTCQHDVGASQDDDYDDYQQERD